MFSNIQNRIDDTLLEISTGRRKQSVVERIRSLEAITDISRTEHAKKLSERLEVRISQQGDAIRSIDESVTRIQQLMISDQSFQPENEAATNAELSALRDNIVSLSESTNVINDNNFGSNREQFNGAGERIDEFTPITAINNIIQITDDFINNKDRSLLGDIQQEADVVLQQLASVGVRVNELNRSQEYADTKILRYEEIRSLAQNADLIDAAVRLSALRTQQEAEFKSFAATSRQSLFNYI